MRPRSWLLAVCLLGAGMFPVVGAPAPACAAETPHAALVVDKGSEVLRYCVNFPAGRTSVTGIELIELAGLQHGLSYRFNSFAGVGLAVCMLDGLEPADGGCLGTPYWAYWHGDGSGGWTFATQGAQASTVPDGGVDGWAWGGSSTQPEPTAPESVCPVAKPSPGPSPTPTPSPTASPSPSPKPSPEPSPSPSPTPAPAESADNDPAPETRTRGSRAAPGVQPTPSPAEAEPSPEPSPTTAEEERAARSATEARRIEPDRPESSPRPESGGSVARGRRLEAVAASRERAGGGPPPAGMAGIGGALLLGAAATALIRRRRRDAER
ncbi:MAG: hypothetical protein M3360_06960 [Actinomycetota bacterium]|nr:hypothetical protein [Actinomycetota bacterium]